MSLLLDAEKFNYAYHRAGGSGFKIAIQDHRDKPIVEHTSLFVHTGSETQIAVSPSLTYTTEAAINAFDPVDRKCLQEFEANLTYFPYHEGYRYEMNNCLLHEAIKKIIWDCRCKPSFHVVEIPEYPNALPYCTGEKLVCLQSKLSNMAIGFEDSNPIIMPESLESPNSIGNITRPPEVACLPTCKIQDSTYQLSSSSYPQNVNFVYRRSFCEVASHVYQVCRYMT